MIAIASNIGTGLFLGSGKALHTSGPFALVAGYVLIAIVLSIMMQCLGEMTTVFPMPGGLVGLANRFLGRDVGFALGWQYW
jgi:amino acid transporter